IFSVRQMETIFRPLRVGCDIGNQSSPKESAQRAVTFGNVTIGTANFDRWKVTLTSGNTCAETRYVMVIATIQMNGPTKANLTFRNGKRTFRPRRRASIQADQHQWTCRSTSLPGLRVDDCLFRCGRKEW